ncbi:hypothetical protein HNY73_006117 [Argiope bruennichi]|uniref:Uncharacterized protein n=1 Tax=Argiope bruennichi TaxID=94029 RepID=A0A8T0FIW7_ARGBR|nr:hypothetical protein HNY73_006117 [Argiope bruennichi]
MMKFVCTTNEIITIEQDGTSEILVEHHIKKVQPTLLVKLENLDLQIRLECTKEEFLEELSMHLGRLKCSTDEINFFLFNDFTNAIQVEDLYEDIFAEARRVTEKVIQQKDFNNYVRKMRVCRHEIKYLYSIWTRYDLNNEEQWNSIVEVLKDLDTLATSFEKKGKSSGPLIYTKYDNSKLSDIKNLKAMSNSDQISTFKSLFIQTEELDCEPAVRYLKKKVKQSCWFLNRRDVAAKNDSENEPSFAERYMKIRKQRRSFLKRRNVGAKNYLEDEVLTKRNSGSSEYAKTEEDQPSTSIEPSVITIEDSEDEVSSAERTSDDKSEDQGSSAERGSSPVTLMEEDQPSTSTGTSDDKSEDKSSSAERTSNEDSEGKGSSAERGSSPVTVMEEDQPSASTGTTVVATEYSEDHVSSTESGTFEYANTEEDQPFTSIDGSSEYANTEEDQPYTYIEETSNNYMMEEDQPSTSTGINVAATYDSECEILPEERTYETPENSESANAPIAGEEVLVDPVEEMLLSVVTDTVDPESIPDPEPEEEPVLIDLTESD